MKCRAVIDTNVLVSALIAKSETSAPVCVLQRIFNQEVMPVFSETILDEYTEVLNREKFHFPKEQVKSFIEEFRELGMLLNAENTDITLPDMSDVPFYAVTLASGIDETFLVTGNSRHFPSGKFVVSPADFLTILDSMPDKP